MEKWQIVKKRKLLYVILACGICLSACNSSGLSENTIKESVAGKTEEVILSGDAEISYTGSAFSEKEINQVIQKEKEFLLEIFPGSALYVPTKGYYHVRTDTSQIDLNFTMLPIIQDDYIVGNMTLHRNEDGDIERSLSMGEERESVLNTLLKTKDKAALLYSLYSAYAITEDNMVYTIYGVEPNQIVDAENIFNAYSTQYNTILSGELFEQDKLIEIKENR